MRKCIKNNLNTYHGVRNITLTIRVPTGGVRQYRHICFLQKKKTHQILYTNDLGRIGGWRREGSPSADKFCDCGSDPFLKLVCAKVNIYKMLSTKECLQRMSPQILENKDDNISIDIPGSTN